MEGEDAIRSRGKSTKRIKIINQSRNQSRNPIRIRNQSQNKTNLENILLQHLAGKKDQPMQKL